MKPSILRCFDFKGRIGRLGYLLRTLGAFLLVLPAVVLMGLVGLVGDPQDTLPTILRMVVGMGCAAATLALHLSNAVKRVHDIGWSGGWAVFLLLPPANLLLVLIGLVVAGNDEGNRHGPRDSG